MPSVNQLCWRSVLSHVPCAFVPVPICCLAELSHLLCECAMGQCQQTAWVWKAESPTIKFAASVADAIS